MADSRSSDGRSQPVRLNRTPSARPVRASVATIVGQFCAPATADISADLPLMMMPAPLISSRKSSNFGISRPENAGFRPACGAQGARLRSLETGNPASHLAHICCGEQRSRPAAVMSQNTPMMSRTSPFFASPFMARSGGASIRRLT
uniref:Uncharacterized protein n=1 Tax=Burkholderia sp. M701 TaxID=326454 RepID=V5YNR3_9BURK|nr:hypothetical protein [Burkholderia sp. M701]